MYKLLITGHSLINYRQHSLFCEMANQYHELEVLVLPSSTWRDETIKPYKKDNIEIKPLPYLGSNYNFIKYWLDGLEKEIEIFNPDVIYIEQEPFSIFTYTLVKLIKSCFPNTKIAIFSWENRMEVWGHYSHYGEYTNYCLKNADVIVCGNKECEVCVKQLSPETNTSVCGQYGIDIKLFKPKTLEADCSKKEPNYDAGYCGRFIEEKGVRFIENLVKELNIKMLWTGGRGDFTPTYGTNLGWLKGYTSLEDYFYKHLKVFLTLPCNYDGYSEQYNASIGEALSMKLPVICTDNGSIPDVYQGSPAIIIPQEDIIKGDFSKIKPILQTLLEDEKERNKLGREGRKWVLGNISNRKVAEKLYNILNLL